MERHARLDGQSSEPVKRTQFAKPGAHPAWLRDSPLTPSGILYLQRTVGNLTVSRAIGAMPGHIIEEWEEPNPPPPPSELSADDIVDAETSAIADTLKKFREIDVTVTGPPEQQDVVPISDVTGDLSGKPPPAFTTRRSKTVTVHAAYYINPSAGTIAAYHSEPSFAKVAKGLKDDSLIQSAGKPYTTGNAVSNGKSTPEDVQAFVHEADNQGLLKTFAHATSPYKDEFPAGKTELVDLPDDTLKDAVQAWIVDKGVGVDCSGFVLQAAIAVRDRIHEVAKDKGMTVPPAYQGDIGHGERNAASFSSGTPRSAPTDIKLGDAWVIGGFHIRIVASTPIEADGQIQFDADESQGSSTDRSVGPTSHTWRTHTTTAFDTMRRLKEGGDPTKKADYELHDQGSHHFYAIS